MAAVLPKSKHGATSPGNAATVPAAATAQGCAQEKMAALSGLAPRASLHNAKQEVNMAACRPQTASHTSDGSVWAEEQELYTGLTGTVSGETKGQHSPR